MSELVMLSWDLTSFLSNATDAIKNWGNYLIIGMGVALIIWGAVKLAIGLMSHGKQPVNWVVIILMFIIGGALAFGGYALMSTIASGGKTTIEELGGSTILMLQQIGF